MASKIVLLSNKYGMTCLNAERAMACGHLMSYTCTCNLSQTFYCRAWNNCILNAPKYINIM